MNAPPPSALPPADAEIDWSFTGPRVACRLVDNRDRALYRALYTSAEVMAQIADPMTVEQADGVFELACRHNLRPMDALLARYWVVSERGAVAAVGIASLVREAPGADAMELGVMLLPCHQRNALGTEVFSNIVELAASIQWRPPLRTLFARHFSANTHAGRLPESCGFRSEQRAAGEIRWSMALPAP